MIRIENFVGPSPDQFLAAMRGMRNPMNSWGKLDSAAEGRFLLGKNDERLAKRLCAAGPEHRKFLRQLPVVMDITAPLYWWRQMSTYKIGTTTDSCSQMHRLLESPFKISNFSFEDLPGYQNIVDQEFVDFTQEDYDKEEWEDLGNGYKVSSLGRVTGLKTKYLKPVVNSDGYCQITMKGKIYRLSRVVAEQFCPKRPEADYVNHINGNKLDNRACNLEWVTQRENIEHSRKNGLQPDQTKFYKGKFTEEERRKIKEQWLSGNYSKRQIAKQWGVSHTCINEMLNGQHKYQDRFNVFDNYAIPLIGLLNELRAMYLAENDPEKKEKYWLAALEILPQSYNQKRTWSGNYEVLRTICEQRQGHKLREWAEFIGWVKLNVPYAEELIFYGAEKEKEAE